MHCCDNFLPRENTKRGSFEFLSPLRLPPLVLSTIVARNENSCAKRESSCRTGSHCRRSSSSQSWSSPPTRGCCRTSCPRAVGGSQDRRLVPARQRGPVLPLLLQRRRRRGEEETGASRGRGGGRREKKARFASAKGGRDDLLSRDAHVGMGRGGWGATVRVGGRWGRLRRACKTAVT